jgi:outer membrane murein-binding lipoprotein Lpp
VNLVKLLISLILVGVLLSGCSNSDGHQEKVAELEKEIAEVYAQLEDKEMELETVSQKPEEGETGEFFTIPKDQVPRLWRDVDAQLWDYLIDHSMAEENGWKKGVTNWREWGGEFDEALGTANQIWETPGLLMNAWMLDVEISYGLGMDVWEINTRINLDENKAEGYIMSYGMHDDSVSGSDIKLTMLKENDFWYVEKAEVRERCSRGVSEDKELCL